MFATLKNAGARVGSQARNLLLLAMTSAPVLAFAQATDPFTDAVTAAGTKIGVYGAALVGVSAIGVVFAIAMKYVKRIPRAS